MCGWGNVRDALFSTSRQLFRNRSDIWGNFRGDEIVEVIKARDSRQSSFKFRYVSTVLDIMKWTWGFRNRSLFPAPETYAARSRYLRWLQVESNYRRQR